MRLSPVSHVSVHLMPLARALLPEKGGLIPSRMQPFLVPAFSQALEPSLTQLQVPQPLFQPALAHMCSGSQGACLTFPGPCLLSYVLREPRASDSPFMLGSPSPWSIPVCWQHQVVRGE